MSSQTEDRWYAARDISTTFVKGLRVLEAFDETHQRLTLPEIGKATGLDRAAVRRLVITLVDAGYVEKTDKTFALSPKVLTLAGSYLRSNAVGAVVQPILDRHSENLGREISMACLSDGSAVLVAQSNVAGSVVSQGFTVGSRLPLLHTAVGRILLAYAAQAGLQDMVNLAPMDVYTVESLMDRVKIMDEVDSARAQGFVMVSGEFESGIAGLSVPVGRLGMTRTAVGISAPAGYLRNADTRETCLNELHLCANDLHHAGVEST